MSQDPRPAIDKLELHARQQLSALVDGELSPDEARFLLRRLEHDSELSGSFERWQLCGDVLRGRVTRAADPDLGARVAAAIAASPDASVQAAAGGGRRFAIARWGGGAALAASVAAVAMLVGRPGAPEQAPVAAPALAVQALPSTEAVLAEVAPARSPVVADPVPSTPRPAVTPRVQREPVGPMVAAVAEARPNRPAQSTGAAPVPEIQAAPDAVAAAPLLPSDPFASSAPLQARPWPRAAMPGASSGYTASFEESGSARAFYPFEPSLPAPPAAPEATDPDALPAPPDEGGGR